MQSAAATDTLALYTMFGAIQQRHRRIIKMFYDCRHKEATQRERETQRKRDGERNKTKTQQRSIKRVLLCRRAGNEERQRRGKRGGGTGASEADWTLSTHWSRLHIHIHSQLQLPHPLSTSTRVALS